MRPTKGVSPALSALGLLLLFLAPAAYSYSVLSHEAIIDSTWDSAIKPLLLKRFPAATPEEFDGSARIRLRRVHYSGFGVLSVRQQVFQRFDTLRPERRFHPQPDPRIADLNEYGFRSGSVVPLRADNNGHSLAVNRAVPLFYPELGRKFGQDGHVCRRPVFSHGKTEFAFDVFQAAKGAMPRRHTKTSSDFKCQNRCWNGRFWTPTG